MAFVSLLLLVACLLLRPMEIWPALGALHPLETLTALTLVGVVYEASTRARASGLRGLSPQFAWLGAFYGWCVVVTVVRLGADAGMTVVRNNSLAPLFMVLVAFSARSAQRLRSLAALFIACVAVMSAVAVHQGVQPPQCLEVRATDGEVETVPDGRECDGVRSCERGGRAKVDYLCERVGHFGTFSAGRRVRWLGQLGDSNELAVFIVAVFPFLLVFVSQRDADTGKEKVSRRSLLFAAPVVALGLWAIVLTQSRGGQLALGTIVAIMFVRRFGAWSVLAAIALVLPIVLLSWREGAEAESSSLERAGILSEGLLLLRSRPIVGVGLGQFAAEMPVGLTAHNSYLLVATEAGLPGYLMWCGLVWMTVKVPAAVARRAPSGLDPTLVRLAEALSISMVGLLVGVFFLSFAYKQVFLLWLGLAAAMHGAVVAAHPDFRVETTRRDAYGIAALGVLALVFVKIASSTAR